MARDTDDRLKRALLLFFVAVSVMLIVGMYVTDLNMGNEPEPAFYRAAPTVDPFIEQTITIPTREHRGPGHATPTAPGSEFTPDTGLMDDF